MKIIIYLIFSNTSVKSDIPTWLSVMVIGEQRMEQKREMGSALCYFLAHDPCRNSTSYWENCRQWEFRQPAWKKSWASMKEHEPLGWSFQVLSQKWIWNNLSFFLSIQRRVVLQGRDDVACRREPWESCT